METLSDIGWYWCFRAVPTKAKEPNLDKFGHLVCFLASEHLKHLISGVPMSPVCFWSCNPCQCCNPLTVSCTANWNSPTCDVKITVSALHVCDQARYFVPVRQQSLKKATVCLKLLCPKGNFHFEPYIWSNNDIRFQRTEHGKWKQYTDKSLRLLSNRCEANKDVSFTHSSIS